MDAQLNSQALKFGGLGLLLQIGGIIFPALQQGALSGVVSLLAVLAGTILLIYGLSLYARGKGYSGWLGLLGLAGCLGLLVLALIPDRQK